MKVEALVCVGSSGALVLAAALALGACGGGGDGGAPTAAEGGGGGTDDGSGSASGGKGGSTSASGKGGSTSAGGKGGTSSTGSSDYAADIAACEGSSPDFSEPKAAEYVQWVVDDVAKEALPPPGGAYFFNGFLNLTTYAADFSGSVSVGVWGQHESVAAGTYRCHEGESTASVTLNGLGLANSTAVGTDCQVTYDADVEDGGQLRGSFWAFFPPSEWPIKSEGGCVHGRFDVTDAAD